MSLYPADLAITQVWSKWAITLKCGLVAGLCRRIPVLVAVGGVACMIGGA